MTKKVCFVLWLSLEFQLHVPWKFSMKQMSGVDMSAVENVNSLQIMLLFSFENDV